MLQPIVNHFCFTCEVCVQFQSFQWFFAEFDLDRDLIDHIIFRLMAIERTNWRFDNTDINVFMLALVHDSIAYPMLFSMLPKKGSSNTIVHVELMHRRF